MDLRRWILEWLGISDLHEKVEALDRRIGDIETLVTSMLHNLGKYRGRTEAELALMRLQLNTLLEAVSNVIEAAENQADIQRAARLRARLRNNLTRLNNADAARVA